MRRRDHVVVALLGVLFVALAVAIALPELAARPAGAAPTPTPGLPEPRPYREGVVGRATSVNPLTARNQAERDLSALVFSGLVRLGPSGSIVPDLASSWSSTPDGRTWTFRLRDDARWHDGQPVTAEDVAFTVSVLQDPAFSGPGAASWREVTVRVTGERTVEFELETPLAGFAVAATQPIVPAHLLRDVPITRLAEAEFGRRPVGSGPFVLRSLDADRAILEPAVVEPAVDSVVPTPATGPTASADGAPVPPVPSMPADRPAGPVPGLVGIEVRFYDDPQSLAEAYAAGEVDTASGLPASEARELGEGPDTRLLRYPGSTLTAVVFNLRPGDPTFRDAKVREALLGAIDRDALIADAFAGLAARADGPIPPASWAFDVAANPPPAYDPEAAAEALEGAGWRLVDETWTPSGVEAPFEIELLSPSRDSNPSTYAAAEVVARGWRELGLLVDHVALPPTELVRDRLRAADFSVAVLDLNIGLDPDLYPLLASTQATSHGSNVAGLQDAELDKLLVAARSPGTDEARRAAYRALEAYLAERHYLLPLAFRDVVVVARDVLVGPTVHQVADPSDRFWDVLTWRLADDR